MAKSGLKGEHCRQYISIRRFHDKAGTLAPLALSIGRLTVNVTGHEHKAAQMGFTTVFTEVSNKFE